MHGGTAMEQSGNMQHDGTHVIEESDFDPIEVGGLRVYVTRLVWNGGKLSFDVREAGTDVYLTDESLPEYPTHAEIAALVEAHMRNMR